jgi:hypothetical protein
MPRPRLPWQQPTNTVAQSMPECELHGQRIRRGLVFGPIRRPVTSSRAAALSPRGSEVTCDGAVATQPSTQLGHQRRRIPAGRGNPDRPLGAEAVRPHPGRQVGTADPLQESALRFEPRGDLVHQSFESRIACHVLLEVEVIHLLHGGVGLYCSSDSHHLLCRFCKARIVA